MQKNKVTPVTLDAIEQLLERKLQEGLQEQNKELRKVIQEEIEFSEARTDIKLVKMEQRIDDNAKKYRDDVLTRMDETMGELETIRQEQLLTGNQVTAHEERIAKLEKLQGVTS
ncbi:MAG TPA: hypothetical protein VLB73_00085 [Patescibacteria group bacterium]|nr:hypothetical protein [Patescibacteria group bacterium]